VGWSEPALLPLPNQRGCPKCCVPDQVRSHGRTVLLTIGRPRIRRHDWPPRRPSAPGPTLQLLRRRYVGILSRCRQNPHPLGSPLHSHRHGRPLSRPSVAGATQLLLCPHHPVATRPGKLQPGGLTGTNPATRQLCGVLARFRRSASPAGHTGHTGPADPHAPHRVLARDPYSAPHHARQPRRPPRPKIIPARPTRTPAYRVVARTVSRGPTPSRPDRLARPRIGSLRGIPIPRSATTAGQRCPARTQTIPARPIRIPAYRVVARNPPSTPSHQRRPRCPARPQTILTRPTRTPAYRVVARNPPSALGHHHRPRCPAQTQAILTRPTRTPVYRVVARNPASARGHPNRPPIPRRLIGRWQTVA